jgi:hypothetical protein
LLTICSNILTSLLHPFTSSMWQKLKLFHVFIMISYKKVMNTVKRGDGDADKQQ